VNAPIGIATIVRETMPDPSGFKGMRWPAELGESMQSLPLCRLKVGRKTGPDAMVTCTTVWLPWGESVTVPRTPDPCCGSIGTVTLGAGVAGAADGAANTHVEAMTWNPRAATKTTP
jgi:hypothetical protein